MACHCCVQSLFRSHARSICQPFAPQALPCFITNMADSDFRLAHLQCLVVYTCTLNTPSVERLVDLLGSAPNFINSPTPTTPVDADWWVVTSHDHTICCCLLSFQKYRHLQLGDFGAISAFIFFRLEYFAVYASFPLLSPGTQDSLRSDLVNLLRRDFHPQVKCSFAQRTGTTHKSGRSTVTSWKI